jgi:mannonate dehydratase
MRLTMVANPPDKTNLTLLRQLGIEDAVHYDMAGLPNDRDALDAIAASYARFGLRWTVAESGPAIDRIVMGKSGWQEQTENYKHTLGHLGDLGVEVVVYNFMPQVSTDAMVVRTTMDRPTRGSALTSGFRLSDVTERTLPHSEEPIARERMWGNLERFLGDVIPAAEAAVVRLPLHPDDPPLPELCGLQRIIGGIDDFDRVFELSGSPANAMTMCFGCFAEAGNDLPALIRRWSGRIGFVHVRDICGTWDDFLETFPDDGQSDLLAAFEALADTGYTGPARSDHAPLLVCDQTDNDGYAMSGHILALGYMRGLAEAAGRTPRLTK